MPLALPLTLALGAALALALAAPGWTTDSATGPQSPAATGPQSPAGAGPARVERRLGAMGTELAITVEAADRPRALQASERAVRALEAAEARLSTWREGTELARLNAAPIGRPFDLSPELRRDLEGAARWWQATEGAFDPAVGALVEAWGLREGGRVPSEEELGRALERTGFDGIELAGERAVRRRDVVLEEGGFGKGAGLDDALAELSRAGVRSARLDLGGQVAVLLPEGASEWVALADPRDRSRPVLEVEIDGGSLATTASSERGIEVDGRRFSHVLDPRSGRPARDFGSLSVWAPDATAADCLSTGLYVLGPERALAAAEGLAVEVLVLEVAGEGLLARATPGLEGRLRILSGDVQLEVAPRAGGLHR